MRAMTFQNVWQALVDADDSAFFSASSAFAEEGDRDMLRSNEAMGDKDLKLALHLSRDAERAYSKGLADRRLGLAQKVEQQLVSAIAAKGKAHRSRLDEVLAHAKQVNLEAHATAALEERRAALPKLSAAQQVSLLRKSQQLLGMQVPATAADAAMRRIAKLARKKGATGALATMDDPDKVLNLNPSVAFPPTHQAGNQWDATPVPKVLDCGPLSNNCNTQQGGEYYAHHKDGAEKKGAHLRPSLRTACCLSPHPTPSKKAAARFAMLAKRDADSIVGVGKGLADSRESFFGKPLLQRSTRKEDVRQRTWLQGSSASPGEDFLKDLAALRGRTESLHEEAGDGAAADVTMKDAADSILKAGEEAFRLDNMQQRLNQRREAVFAEFVGPLALEDRKVPLAVTVDRFAREWVPPGGVTVPSMLKVTPLSSDVAPPPAAYTAQEASALKQPDMGMEGLSLERALEALNEQQILLNKQRASLFRFTLCVCVCVCVHTYIHTYVVRTQYVHTYIHEHTHTHTHTHTYIYIYRAAVGGKALPLAAVMNESPVLIQWSPSSDLPSVTGASVDPLNGVAPRTPSSSSSNTATSATERRLKPEENPSVDYMGRSFVGGAKPHAPAGAAPGRHGASAGQFANGGQDPRYAAEPAPAPAWHGASAGRGGGGEGGGGAHSQDEALITQRHGRDMEGQYVSRWADERPTVHHANPRNKVADLMKELDVSGVNAETSFTKDPYDPWQPKKARGSPPTNRASLHASSGAGADTGAGADAESGAGSDASSYKTATSVFKAASAAYEAASATWKDLEAKEAQAQAVHGMQKQEPANLATNSATNVAPAAQHSSSAAAPAQPVAAVGVNSGSTYSASAATAGAEKTDAGASGVVSAARGADDENNKHESMASEEAKAAQEPSKAAHPPRHMLIHFN